MKNRVGGGKKKKAFSMLFNLVDFLFLLTHLHLILIRLTRHQQQQLKTRHFCRHHSRENMTNACSFFL
jgi:hypothetical protein